MFERDILDVYKFCGIDSFPVDLHKIINSLEYTLRSYREESNSAERLKELRIISGDAFLIRNRKTIFYNDKVSSQRRIRFTLAHELGHIILVTNNEDLADVFASNLLAPRPVVCALQMHTADEISSFFNVSISMANNVVMEMYKHGTNVPNKSWYEMMKYFGFEDNSPTLDNVVDRIRMVR